MNEMEEKLIADKAAKQVTQNQAANAYLYPQTNGIRYSSGSIGVCVPSTKWKFCPADGTELKPEWVFCPKCSRQIQAMGVSITGSTAAASLQQASGTESIWQIGKKD